MIKIKIKKTINEAQEFKYPSKEIRQDIENFAISAKKNFKPEKKFFHIPLKEILYSDKEKVLSGLPFFYQFHILNKAEYSKPSGKITNKTLPLRIKAIFLPNASNRAIAGAATVNNNTLFNITLYLNKIKTDSFESTIRHELQHITAIVNDACLYYGEELAKLKDPKKVKLRNIKEIPKKFGLGQQKTGTLDISDPNDPFATVGGDAEYETYFSELMNLYYKRLMQNKQNITSDVKNMGANKAAAKYIKLLLTQYKNEPGYENIKGILEKIMEKRPEEMPKDMVQFLTSKFEAL